MESPLSKRSMKRVTEGSHWRESKQVLFPMISVLRTACSSARSCFPGTDKEQRVLEKWHTKEENILDPLKLNVPWQKISSIHKTHLMRNMYLKYIKNSFKLILKIWTMYFIKKWAKCLCRHFTTEGIWRRSTWKYVQHDYVRRMVSQNQNYTTIHPDLKDHNQNDWNENKY